MLIKKLSAIAALSGFALVSSSAMADDNAELKEMLLQQQKQIEMLQKKVEKQETVHNEALTHYIKNEIDRALAAKSSSLLTLGSNVENLTFKGDLRVRYEARESDTGASRDRFRQRFRLGFLWKTNEGWEIGAGLITGEQNNTDGASGATSGNDTYSANSPFETGGIFLDYAYAKHKFENGLSLTLGQHKNPYINAADYMFDSDVRFVGATLHYDSQDSGLFATAGAYVVQTFQGTENDDANLYALQVGMEEGGFLVALSYYHFDGAASDDVLGTGTNEVNVISGYAEYSGKTDMFKYKFFGEYSVNVAADDSGTSQVGGVVTEEEDENIAFVLGAELGIDKWKIKYAFAHIESDSYFGPLTDADFGTAISNSNNSNNIEGHEISVGYNVTKNFQIEATYIMAEQLDGNVNDEGELFQLDFKYKF